MASTILSDMMVIPIVRLLIANPDYDQASNYIAMPFLSTYLIGSNQTRKMFMLNLISYMSIRHWLIPLVLRVLLLTDRRAIRFAMH